MIQFKDILFIVFIGSLVIFSGCLHNQELNKSISHDLQIKNESNFISENKSTLVEYEKHIKTPEELKKEYTDRIVITGSNQSDIAIVKNVLYDTNYKTLKFIKEIHILDVESLDCESSNIFCFAKYSDGYSESDIILEEQSSIIYTPASNMWLLFKPETTVEKTESGTMELTTTLCSSFEYSLVKKIGIIDARRHGLNYEDRIVDKSDFPPGYTSNFYSEAIYVDYYAGFHSKDKVTCG